jgi:hypothetical protein
VLLREKVLVKIAFGLSAEIAWGAGVVVHFISYIYTFFVEFERIKFFLNISTFFRQIHPD